jgi:putative oxidoreductase
MSIVVIVFEVMLVLAFLLTGARKLMNTKDSLERRDTLKMPPWFWTLTGVLEVLGALGLVVGIFWHPLAVASAIGLAIVMAGATIVNLLRRQPASHAVTTVVLLALSVFVAVVDWSDLTKLFS